MTHHPYGQAFHFSGRCGWRFLAFLLALLGFPLAVSLLFGLDVLVSGSPETREKVVERTDARDFVQGEAAENGINWACASSH